MQKLGASNRRKSYAQVLPILPRKSYSRQSGTRTAYQQLPSMSQQLKIFKRRLLFDHVPIQKLTIINKSSRSNKTNQYEYHYSSQTTNHKNNYTLATMGSQTDQKFQKNFEQSKAYVSQFQVENNNVNRGNQMDGSQEKIRLNIDDDNAQSNLNQNMHDQDYTMGNKIQVNQEQDQDQDQNKNEPKFKSFSKTQNYLNNYNKNASISQAEARMEKKYLQGKFQHLKARRNDNQFLKMLNDFKQNKQTILKQSNRKNQTMRALANIRKATSLPKLPNLNYNSQKVQQIIVPSYQQIMNPDGSPEEYQRRLAEKRLQVSMSLGKLMNKKNKNINYQQYLQEQLGETLQTERKLRQKGIKINSNILKNSLINIRDLPQEIQEGTNQFPIPRLISNPFHPKQVPKNKIN